MTLSEEQIEFIHGEIVGFGITLDDLALSLLDHICCAIEESEQTDFQTAYENAVGSFGKNGLTEIQIETNNIIQLKKEKNMKKTMYVIGFLAAFVSTTGILFKVQHWPGANVAITMGIFLLNFGYLPLYFYSRYKESVS